MNKTEKLCINQATEILSEVLKTPKLPAEIDLKVVAAQELLLSIQNSRVGVRTKLDDDMVLISKSSIRLSSNIVPDYFKEKKNVEIYISEDQTTILLMPTTKSTGYKVGLRANEKSYRITVPARLKKQSTVKVGAYKITYDNADKVITVDLTQRQ